MEPTDRELHHRWLLELTQIPTAAGVEWRVIDWIRAWVGERPELAINQDSAGNLEVRRSGLAPAEPGGKPLYITAHLDHPAFVVERVIGPGTVQVAFRGGVMDEYFDQARVVIHPRKGGAHRATLNGRVPGTPGTFPAYIAELDAEVADDVHVGDIATWELPPARIQDGLLHTHACDDLAALAAAVAAYDVLLRGWREGKPAKDVRLLFTRAEEVGFIGAIAACRGRTLPEGARVIALENSRSFDDSPIGGGPIVRVGDRMSIFTPSLTAAVAKRAEELAGGAAPTATEKLPDRRWKWQRKLMAGGACEATVFCAYGYEATCVCLPLGNYHNMADLAAVQARTNAARPRVAPEFISVADFDGLVDLLVACGERLPAGESIRERIDKLWTERGFVVEGEGEGEEETKRRREEETK